MTTVERVLTLKQIDLLESAGPRHLLALADLVREVEMWAGQAIYGEADLADAIYVVFKGRVRLLTGAAPTPQNGDFRGTTGRSTFVHEFGHFFGFNHEDVHAVLRTTPPHLITGGSEPSTVWPSDTIGMSSVYGFSITRPNLLPSALGVVGSSVQTLDPATTVTMCRGAPGSGSTLARSRLTCTSRVLVSPT